MATIACSRLSNSALTQIFRIVQQVAPGTPIRLDDRLEYDDVNAMLADGFDSFKKVELRGVAANGRTIWATFKPEAVEFYSDDDEDSNIRGAFSRIEQVIQNQPLSATESPLNRTPRRLKQAFSSHVRGGALRPDDLREVFQVLRRAVPDLKIRLDRRIEYPDVDTMLESQVRTWSELDFVGNAASDPGIPSSYVSVVFRPKSAHLYCDDDRDLAVAGALAETRRLLERTRPLGPPYVLAYRIVSAALTTTVIALYICGFALLFSGNRSAGSSCLAAGFVALVLSWVSGASWGRAVKAATLMQLVPLSTSPGWWNRNRDALIVQLLVGLLLVVATSVLSFLIGRATA